MMKKLLLILCIVLCMAGLTACGTTPEEKTDYNGVTTEELKTQSESFIETLQSMDALSKQQVLASGEEVVVKLINSYDEVVDKYGSFKEAGEFIIAKSGHTVTTEQKLEFEKGKAIITFVYDSTSMQFKDVTLDPVYSTGEKLQHALLNTLLGMGTVFVMLVIISLVISCFKFIPYFEQKLTKGKQTEVVEIQKPAPIVEVPEETVQDDLELVAVITAAIAAASGQSEDDFVVRSIKRR